MAAALGGLFTILSADFVNRGLTQSAHSNRSTVSAGFPANYGAKEKPILEIAGAWVIVKNS